MSDHRATVYLDHAATTPMVPEAIEAMTAQLTRWGNPSSLHAAGRDARRVVEEARETIAQALNCRPTEVIFTSGGTEADNLAVKGLYRARRAASSSRSRVLCSAVEHHAVLDAVEHLGKAEDADVRWLPVDSWGRLDLDRLGDVFAHQLRWGRTYRVCRPASYLATVLTQTTLWAVVHAISSGFTPC